MTAIHFYNKRIPFFAYEAHEVNTEGPTARYFLQEPDWPTIALLRVKVEQHERELSLDLSQLLEPQVQQIADVVESVCKYFTSSLRLQHTNPITARAQLDIPVSRRCKWEGNLDSGKLVDIEITIRGVIIDAGTYLPLLSVDSVSICPPQPIRGKRISSCDYSPGLTPSDAPSYEPSAPKNLCLPLSEEDWTHIAEAVANVRNPAAAAITDIPLSPTATVPPHQSNSPGSQYYWNLVRDGREEPVIQYYRCRKHKFFICPDCQLHVSDWHTFKSEHAGCHSFQSQAKINLCRTSTL